MAGKVEPKGNGGTAPDSGKVTSLPTEDRKAPLLPDRPREPPVEPLAGSTPDTPAPAGTPLVTVPAEMQKRIDEAIRRGTVYLLDLLPNDAGTWPGKPRDVPGGPEHKGWPPPPPVIHFRVSYASFPGLTLLYCGVPKDDPQDSAGCRVCARSPLARSAEQG